MIAPEIAFDQYRATLDARISFGEAFATQILATTSKRFEGRDPSQLRVLDVGCGYGMTSRALAKRCASVVGIEPDEAILDAARSFAPIPANLQLEKADVLTWRCDDSEFDLIFLDNVYEHIADHRGTVAAVSRLLKPGGVFLILVPNRLWPIEAHYRLPFLSYLPLPLANLYLRITRRGTDYTDCSYAPTYWSLKRDLASQLDLEFSFTLPADISLAQAGAKPLYRLGVAMLSHIPALWIISKALLVVGNRKQVAA